MLELPSNSNVRASSIKYMVNKYGTQYWIPFDQYQVFICLREKYSFV